MRDPAAVLDRPGARHILSLLLIQDLMIIF
jgi:hypothetical protein